MYKNPLVPVTNWQTALIMISLWVHAVNTSHSADAPEVDSIVTLLNLVIDADETTARKCLSVLTTHIQNGSLPADRVQEIRDQLGDQIHSIIANADHSLRFDAALLAAGWRDSDALELIRRKYLDGAAPAEQRLAALQGLVAAGAGREVLHAVSDTINDPQSSPEFRIAVIEKLSGIKDEQVGLEVARLLVDNLPQWAAEVRPKAIEVLTQRPGWSVPLLAAIQRKEIDREALNLNQLRRIASFKDEALQAQFKEIFGAIRDGRNPNREQVINVHRDFLRGTPGDPAQGHAVFKKVCAQCHKIYGEGADVGPDITRNGRNNWDQLLTNVFDPSAVIGPGYQARLLATTDGRVLTGLPVEESELRVILKIQGGKLETIPRDQIEEYKISDLSLMPDELEKQLSPQQLADLFAFLALDQLPDNPDAKLLNGAPEPKPR